MNPLPKPLDFGVKSMCAALCMTEDAFVKAYRNGEIAPPDTVRLREGRWSFRALGKENNKRSPPAGVTGLGHLIGALEALARAEIAEGMRDEGGQS